MPSLNLPFPVISKQALLFVFKALAVVGFVLMPGWLVLGRAAAEAAMSSIALFYLLTILITRDGSMFKRTEVRYLAVFWAAYVLSTFLQGSTGMELLKAFIYFRFLLAYVAIRYWLLTDDKWLRYAAWFALPMMAFVVFDGWWQYLDGVQSWTGHILAGAEHDRLTGPLTHPNLGNYLYKILLPIMAIWYVVWRQLEAVNQRWLLGAGAFIISVAALALIPLSGERSITLVFLVAVVSFFALIFWRVPQYRKVAYIAAAGCVVLVAWLSTQPVIQSRLDLLVEQLGHFMSTPYGQLAKGAWLIIADHPLWGIGHAHYFSVCQTYADQGLLTYCDIHPHNTYLQWWVSTGIFGMTALLLWTARLLWRALQDVRSATQNRALLLLSTRLALLVAFFFPFIIMQDFYSNWPACLYWYTLALILSLKQLVVSHDA